MADDSEFEEEQSSKGPDFQRYLDIARRRHMYFLIPLLAVVPVVRTVFGDF
jgi:hypothetical protein